MKSPTVGRSLPAKVTPPSSEEAVHRERLFEWLDNVLPNTIAWISAPAGAGKTTLISSYLEARTRSCLWYQVDAGDADPATFFHYLGLAAGQGTSSADVSLPHLTVEYRQSMVEFGRSFFAALGQRVEPGCVLVFDNLHEVPDDAFLHTILVESRTRLPAGMSVILASRSAPPSAYARLRANRQLRELGPRELRLDGEEVYAIARQDGLESLDQDAARQLGERLDGWAAGLQLLLVAARTRSLDPADLAQEAPEELLDYFGEEVFQRLPEETRRFLLRASFLHNLEPTVAQKFTGNAQAGSLLASLHRRNQFTERRSRTSPVYQFHPLFREFLQHRATARFDVAERRRLHRRAAELLSREGQSEEAADHLRQAGDWEGLAVLIVGQAPVLVEQGRRATLEQWLLWLPDGCVEGDPWLTHWLGACRLAADPSESLHLFQKAFEHFRSQPDDLGIFLSWCGAFDAVRHDWAGSHRRWATWAALMEEVLTEHAFPSTDIECRVARRLSTALDWLTPGNPKAEHWRGRVLDLAGGDLSLRVEALADAAQVAVLQFGQVRAGREIDALERALRAGALSPYALEAAALAQGMHLVSVGRLSESVERAHEGLAIAKSTGLHVWDVLLYTVLGAAALFQGDTEEAMAVIETMAALPDAHGGFGAQQYHQLAAWAALQVGRLQNARVHADEWLKISHQTGFPSYVAMAYRVRAHVVRALGRVEESWEDLREALEACQGVGCPLVEWRCRVDEAYFHLLDGDEEQALPALEIAFGMGAKEGHLNGDIGALARLCPVALRHGIETKYVQQLIRTRSILPNAAAQTMADWPWPLRVQTLGRFEVRKEGEGDKALLRIPKKPLALLKALVALGGRGVAETHLADALWPDATGDLQHQTLATTLHRLRNVLGIREVIRVGEGRVTLDERYCWVDAWAFERLAQEAERKGDRAAGERALQQYRGPFLANDEEEPWTISLREKLRSQFLRLIASLTEAYVREEAWETAVACCRRGIEVEPLDEALHRNLMVCYREMGRPADSMAAYRRCRGMLVRAFGVEPSRETQTVLATLGATPRE